MARGKSPPAPLNLMNEISRLFESNQHSELTEGSSSVTLKFNRNVPVKLSSCSMPLCLEVRGPRISTVESQHCCCCGGPAAPSHDPTVFD